MGSLRREVQEESEDGTMNIDKVKLEVHLSPKAADQLAWLTRAIFNCDSRADTVLERAIDDMYVSLVKEL